MAKNQPGVRIEFTEEGEAIPTSAPVGLYNQVSKEEIRSRAPYQSQDWVDMVYEFERDDILRAYEKELNAIPKPRRELDAWAGRTFPVPGDKERYEKEKKALHVKYFGE